MVSLQMENVFFSYPGNQVLKGLSFSLESGEKRALIGKNGSGKTTTLRILSGLVRSTGGEVKISGLDPQDPAVKSKVGYLPEDASPYRLLSVRENVEYSAALRGIEDPADSAIEILDYFDLRSYSRVRAANLSRGNMQRLSISMALVHKPEIMILDEPLNYLDFPAQELAVDFIRRSNATVVVSTHILSTASRLTDRLMLLSEGSISWIKTIPEIEETGQSGDSLETKVARMMNA